MERKGGREGVKISREKGEGGKAVREFQRLACHTYQMYTEQLTAKDISQEKNYWPIRG